MWTLPVRVLSQSRDPWDWVIYGLTVATFLLALWGLLAWVAEQRKRPEIRFRWYLPNTEPWEIGNGPLFEVGQVYVLRVAIDNIGNGTAETATVNVVAPECLQLNPGEPISGTFVIEPMVGLPPAWRATCLVPPTAVLTPGLTWFLDFKVRAITTQTPGDVDLPFKIIVSVEDPRLNTKGRRILPILVSPLDEIGAVPDPWPGSPVRRTMSKGKAQPTATVRILPGRRIDMRTFRTTPARSLPPGATSSEPPANAEDQV